MALTKHGIRANWSLIFERPNRIERGDEEKREEEEEEEKKKRRGRRWRSQKGMELHGI